MWLEAALVSEKALMEGCVLPKRGECIPSAFLTPKICDFQRREKILARNVLTDSGEAAPVNCKRSLDRLGTGGLPGPDQALLVVAGVEQRLARIAQPAPPEPGDRGRPERSVTGLALGLQAGAQLQQNGQIGHH